MLKIKGLHAGYGASDVLHDVTFDIGRGAFHALIGANGAGKSTTMKAVSGLLRPVRGSITFEGEDISKLSAARIVARGVCTGSGRTSGLWPQDSERQLGNGCIYPNFPQPKKQYQRAL